MTVKKIAISLPEDVLNHVDRLAKRAKISRSGCIARVLTQVSQAATQAEITAHLNDLFGNTAVARDQSVASHFFLRAAEPGFEDPEW